MIRLVTSSLLLSLVVAAWPGPAQAQAPQVAVDRIRGPQGARLRTLLVRNLEENGLVVVDRALVEEAAVAATGRRRLRDDDYPIVARELNIKAFIEGRVARARRSWTLRLTVRNGADGMNLGTVRWTGRTLGALRSVGRNGYRRLSDLLALASSPAPAAPQPIEPPPGETPWYQRSAAEEPAEEAEEAEADEPSTGSPGRWTGLRVGLLAGTLHRSMSTEALVDPSFRTPFEPGAPIPEPREYDSAGLGHLELGVRAELYPGALLDDPVVPWLGLMVQYRHSVGLSSEGPSCLPAQEPAGAEGRCPAASVVPVETSQQEVSVGVRADANLGDDRRGPWVTADVGWGRFSFDLDTRDLALLDRTFIVPPVRYDYVHLGAGARYGVHELVQLGARVAYRLGLGVGAEARHIWGEDTSSTGGFQVGVDLVHYMSYLTEGLFATLSFEFFRFKTKFRGQTRCRVPGPDGLCDPYELWEPWPEAGGVITGGIPDPVEDNYLRLGLTLGYELQ